MTYQPAKFGDHSYSGSGVVMNLVCHVILQDQVMKESCDFMGESPSQYVTNLLSLVAIAIAFVEI